ncbi:hypothetical protein KIL84_012817 [Mauremys mutica]|uniref:Uncharacterized protein n=1 Tax=Mauremys mutica TaxID=74926 RepID=A0A9D4B8Q5_9SAUR|nr:hypothetical protein KIL84_012817 [Mauremys mutica]
MALQLTARGASSASQHMPKELRARTPPLVSQAEQAGEGSLPCTQATDRHKHSTWQGSPAAPGLASRSRSLEQLPVTPSEKPSVPQGSELSCGGCGSGLQTLC